MLPHFEEMKMNERKKVLILTVTAGNGHNACARAMEAQLKKLDADVKVIDFLKAWSDAQTIWTVDKGYNLAVAHALRTYNASYRRLKRRIPEKRYMLGFAQKVGLSAVQGLWKEICTFRPDVIYCTHIYPAVAISDLRMICDVPAKVYISAFDFTMCPFWEACIGVDYINLPSADFADECLRLGYRKEQFLYCGIPVDEKFLLPMEKTDAREKLGLDPAAFTVMIMFGGGQWNGGYKIFHDVLRIAETAPRPMQIIMINGHNKDEKEKIDHLIKNGKLHGVRVLNVGFTNEVETYMAAADAIVTKLGGTGATECIDRLLPIVAAKKLLPQQEAENADYLSARGAALTYKSAPELRAHLLRLMGDHAFYEGMRNALASLRKGGVAELARHVIAAPKAVYPAEMPEMPNLRKRMIVTLRHADSAARHACAHKKSKTLKAKPEKSGKCKSFKEKAEKPRASERTQ